MKTNLETTKQELKESVSAFITKWRSKATQMMNRLNEEEQLIMIVKTCYLYTINICLLNTFQILKL